MSSMMSTSFAPSAVMAPMSADQVIFKLPEASEAIDDSKSKSFRRSRSGCYTCRVRRKKCDEERPSCQACRKLCLKCDYRPPQWWISAEARRVQKERIKDRIRQTKIMEKHGSLQEYMDRIHALTLQPTTSALTAEYDFSQPVLNDLNSQYNNQSNNSFTAPLLTPVIPYNIDIQADHEMMLANVPLPYGTSMSALTPLAPPPHFHITSPVTPVSAGIDWSQNIMGYTQPYDTFNSVVLPFQNTPLSSTFQTTVPLDAHDRPLLDHFIDNVIPLVFPILEVHPQGLLSLQEAMNSLQTNRSYLHCCLSVSAIHLKNSRGLTDQMDYDIMRHRYDAISHLCRSLNGKPTQEQILDGTLAMIFYHCSIGEMDEYLPDIPWNAHFKAVSNLVNNPNCAPTQFNVSLITWIDILGATMLGQTPQFAHTYRTKHLGGTPSGLQQLMGCDDRIMYLISEIACLESLRLEGKIDDLALSQHVSALNAQLEWTEPVDRTLEPPYSPAGLVQPEQLTKIITAIFRTAARIYLYSLMPGFDCYEPMNITLVAAVAEILQCLPAGPNGYDRCLVWPLFIAGASSAPYSGYRKILTDRVAAMGYLNKFGNLGRMYRVLQKLWKQSDDPIATSSTQTASGQDGSYQAEQGDSGIPQRSRGMHWRELMQHKKWDYLLM